MTVINIGPAAELNVFDIDGNDQDRSADRVLSHLIQDALRGPAC